MINLFKAYQVSTDSDFSIFIKTNIDKYYDVYKISEDELMTSALNRFENLRKYNKQNSIYLEQEHIIALASIVEKIKENNLKLVKNFKNLPTGKGKCKGTSKGNGKIQKQTFRQSQ